LNPDAAECANPGLGWLAQLGNPGKCWGCDKNVDFIRANRQELGFQYVKHVDFAGENEEMNWIPE